MAAQGHPLTDVWFKWPFKLPLVSGKTTKLLLFPSNHLQAFNRQPSIPIYNLFTQIHISLGYQGQIIFKVIQGRWFPYQQKACTVKLPINVQSHIMPDYCSNTALSQYQTPVTS